MISRVHGRQARTDPIFSPPGFGEGRGEVYSKAHTG